MKTTVFVEKDLMKGMSPLYQLLHAVHFIPDLALYIYIYIYICDYEDKFLEV